MLRDILRCFTNDAAQHAAEVMLSAAMRKHSTFVSIRKCVHEIYRRSSVHSAAALSSAGIERHFLLMVHGRVAAQLSFQLPSHLQGKIKG